MNQSKKHNKKKKAKNIVNDLEAQNSALEKIIDAVKKGFQRNNEEGKNKRFIFLVAGSIFLFCSFYSSYAQETGLCVLSSSGTYHEVSGASLEWTLGESVISSFNTAAASLSQGFHQSGLMITSVPEFLTSNLKIYPNPFRDDLSLHLEDMSEPAQALIFDLSGNILNEYLLTQPDNKFHLEKLETGMYFLKLTINRESKTLKIIKQ